MKNFNLETQEGAANAISALNSIDGLRPESQWLDSGDICAASNARFMPDFMDKALTEFLNGQFAANATKHAEATFQQPLTQYSVGWQDSNDLDGALEWIAPGVQVADRFEYAETPNAEGFLSDASAEDLRAIGSDFARVEYTGSKTLARTFNRGLTIRVDDDAVKGMTNWRELYVGRLTARLKRNEIRRAWALLIAAATNNAKTWDTTAGKDPDQDMLTARKAFLDAVALPPTKCLITDGAWNKRSISLRAQNLLGQGLSASKTVAELAEFMQCPIRIAKERYATSATAKALLGGASEYVFFYIANSGAMTDDPSNIKCFWTPCINGGGRFAVYQQRFGSKFTDLTVEHYSLTKITSTLGIQSLTIS